MITCQDCIERCYPGDPRVRSGAYGRNGCDYCDKPTYYRDLERQPPPQQVIVHRHSDMRKEDYNLLQQMARRVGWLEKKLVAGQKREHKPEVTTKPKYIGAI